MDRGQSAGVSVSGGKAAGASLQGTSRADDALADGGGRRIADFAAFVAEVSAQGRVSQMRTFVQHGSVSTYAHVVRVAHTSWRWARALKLRVSEPELVRAALLHDYYLYDWHHTDNKGHAVNHPVIAARNAAEDFDLTPKERNIIEAHMWPLPPARVPASREAWLVCAADKWCSLGETLFKRH